MYIFIHRKLLKDEQLLTMISSGECNEEWVRAQREREVYFWVLSLYSLLCQITVNPGGKCDFKFSRSHVKKVTSSR